MGRGKFCSMDPYDETRELKQRTMVVACIPPIHIRRKEGKGVRKKEKKKIVWLVLVY